MQQFMTLAVMRTRESFAAPLVRTRVRLFVAMCSQVSYATRTRVNRAFTRPSDLRSPFRLYLLVNVSPHKSHTNLASEFGFLRLWAASIVAGVVLLSFVTALRFEGFDAVVLLALELLLPTEFIESWRGTGERYT